MSSRGTDGAFHPEAMNNLFLSEKLIFRPVSCVHLCVCVYVCVYVCVCVCVRAPGFICTDSLFVVVSSNQTRRVCLRFLHASLGTSRSRQPMEAEAKGLKTKWPPFPSLHLLLLRFLSPRRLCQQRRPCTAVCPRAPFHLQQTQHFLTIMTH